MLTDWKDVVFLDYLGVDGKTLSEVMTAYANDNELHHEAYPGAGYCTCVWCQTFIPMAEKLEKELPHA